MHGQIRDAQHGLYVWGATTNYRITWKFSNLLNTCKVLKELD